MGDIVKGLYGGGTSGSLGAGRGNIKQKNTYIGENANQKPLEDILGRLAGEANQQLAQRNLLFGGAGYGGSFESNDQRAARAADPNHPLTQKPYGGWGGFGSQNATLGGQEWNGYVPPTTGGPPGSPTGGGTPITGADTPITGADIPAEGGGPEQALPPGATPVPAPTPTPGVYDKSAPTDFSGLLEQIKKAISGGGLPKGGAVSGGDATGKPTIGGGAPTGQPGSTGSWPTARTPDGKTVKLNTTAQGPALQIFQNLVAKGLNPESMFPSDSINNVLASGDATPEQIQKHYETLLAKVGPEVFNVAHGSLGLVNGQGFARGTMTSDQLANAGAVSGGGGLIPGAAPTSVKASKGQPPSDAWGASLAAANAAAAAKGAPAAGGTGYAVTGEPQMASMAVTVPGATETPSMKVGKPPTDPVNYAGGEETKDPKTWQDYYDDFVKNGGKLPEGFADWLGSMNDVENPQRPSQFGPQGFNPTKVPKLDAKGNPVLDANGQPIMEDIDPSTATGTAGYAGGDTWSTSALWRPEEPTGGLYGAYTQLASGNLTDYENNMLQGWKDMSTKANRGEDEAYGAYSDMLKQGYSPAEQNAITQQGMAAARAGFETNRDAMLRNQSRTGNSAGYAANMAKMARGFGETMGSQARQNQIDFANEAERRKEGGAAGMLNVAQLGQTRKTTGLQGQQGAGSYARDLQQKGLQGLHALYTGQDPSKQWATAAGIASNPRETYTESGNASL